MYYDRWDVVSAIRGMASEFTYGELSRMLDVSKSVVYAAVNRGRVFPSLRDALGMWPEHKPRYRIALEFDNEQDAELMRETLALYTRYNDRTAQSKMLLAELLRQADNRI